MMKVISQEGSAGYKDNLKEKKLETGERIKQQVFNFLISYKHLKILYICLSQL